jgi:hypothetical protein
MTRYRVLAVGAAVACAVAGAASAQGATRADFAKKCGDAWPGSKTTAAFRAYSTRCTNAAIAATNAATDAGNPTNAGANRTRAQAACAVRFPAPRNTAAKRTAYNACVAAARASQLAFAGRPLRAALKGSNEVPPAGGATGSALIRLNEGQRRICFTITVAGFGAVPATAAHIHEGVAGATGPPVVAFSDIDSLNRSPFAARGCVQNVDAGLIKRIRQHPERFYVNVHNTQYPDGAARGQLRK